MKTNGMLYMRFLIFVDNTNAFMRKGQNFGQTQTAVIAPAIEDGTVENCLFSEDYRGEVLNLKSSPTILEIKLATIFFL